MHSEITDIPDSSFAKTLIVKTQCNNKIANKQGKKRSVRHKKSLQFTLEASQS